MTEKEKKRIHGEEDRCSMTEQVMHMDERLLIVERDVGKIKKNQDKIISNEENILSELKEVSKYSNEFKAFYGAQKVINEHVGKTLDRITDMCDRFDKKHNETDLEMVELRYSNQLANKEQDLRHEKEKRQDDLNSMGNQFIEGFKKHWIKLAVGFATSGILFGMYQMATTFAKIAESMPK